MAETQKQATTRLNASTMLRDALDGLQPRHIRDLLPELLAERFANVPLDGPIVQYWDDMMDLGHRICRKADELERNG